MHNEKTIDCVSTFD